MTIKEVSEKFDIPADTLRYYERIGLIPKVGRTGGGIRRYSAEDIRWVEFAKCMRSAGVQVEALIEYVALCQQGETTEKARKQILVEQRERLLEKMNDIKASIERLDGKIEQYEQKLLPFERKLTKQEK